MRIKVIKDGQCISGGTPQKVAKGETFDVSFINNIGFREFPLDEMGNQLLDKLMCMAEACDDIAETQYIMGIKETIESIGYIVFIKHGTLIQNKKPFYIPNFKTSQDSMYDELELGIRDRCVLSDMVFNVALEDTHARVFFIDKIPKGYSIKEYIRSEPGIGWKDLGIDPTNNIYDTLRQIIKGTIT